MTVLQNKTAERAKRLLCFIDPFASLGVRTCLSSLLRLPQNTIPELNYKVKALFHVLTGMIITVTDIL